MRIQLYGPSVRNNGEYVDAGATIDVGTEAEQIDADRAQELLDQTRAIPEAGDQPA